MDDVWLIRRYWGKAKPEASSGPQWYLLIYHSLRRDKPQYIERTGDTQQT